MCYYRAINDKLEYTNVILKQAALSTFQSDAYLKSLSYKEIKVYFYFMAMGLNENLLNQA